VAAKLNDTDNRTGFIAGAISFGPNAVDGYIDEAPIDGYVVHFVDGCFVPFGDALATVPKKEGVPTECCSNDAYTAEVSTHVPMGAAGIIILPLTETGPLTVGEIMELVDYAFNHTPELVIVGSSSTVTASRPSWSLVASVAFVAVVALLTS
jgi:hypothetical protein